MRYKIKEVERSKDQYVWEVWKQPGRFRRWYIYCTCLSMERARAVVKELSGYPKIRAVYEFDEDGREQNYW